MTAAGASTPPRTRADRVAPRLFVYGLLRPGERYWHELAPAVRTHRPARVYGRLYVHASGEYPLLEVGDDGWVRGDLLDVADAAVVHRLAFMELAAGYEARWLDAFPLDDGRPASGVAFAWPWGPVDRGARIVSGDWQRR